MKILSHIMAMIITNQTIISLPTIQEISLGEPMITKLTIKQSISLQIQEKGRDTSPAIGWGPNTEAQPAIVGKNGLDKFMVCSKWRMLLTLTILAKMLFLIIRLIVVLSIPLIHTE